MKVIERVILRERRADTFRVYFLTDWHVGTVFCDEDKLRSDIQAIANDPKAYFIGGGDFGEFINRSDKRHRESNLAPWLYGEDDIAKRQVERIVELMQPIKHKCLALVKGNHEDAIVEKYERDVYSAIVDEVTQPDKPVRLGYGGFLVIRWRYMDREKGAGDVWTTVGFIHHGAGGGLLPGGHALTLGRLPTWYNFDFALLGHRHVRQVVTNEQWQPSPRANKIVCRRQVMAFGGSYMKGFDEKLDTEGYAERKMLPPRGTGSIILEFRPAEREIRVLV